MLSKHINTNFDGVNSESINWMKHYLNGGDEVGAAWNGICDSVSGYTYKYSNQFEFDIKKSDLIGDTNLVGAAYGWRSVPPTEIGPQNLWFSSQEDVTVSVPNDTEFDLTFARLPFPDLPGVLFVKMLSGYSSWVATLHYGDSGFSNSFNFRFSNFCIPIEDPNWTPDCIVNKKRATIITGTTQNTSKIGFGAMPMAGVDVEPGFSKDITAYRLAGASMTFTCTAPAIYKNGTIVAVGATTPYRLGQEQDVLIDDPSAAITSGDNTHLHIYAQDLPVGYTTISSVKSYHKFKMSEGAYCVLHNTQGVYLFNNLEDNHQPISSTLLDYANGRICTLAGIKVYSNGTSTFYPFAFPTSKSIYNRYTNHSCIPRYCIPDSPITEWNTCVVSPTQTNSDDTLIYSCKFNTYAECYVSSFSRLKPSVSMTSMYYPRLLEYLSGFYHKFDGIYPSSWNDGNHIWELFKRFLSNGGLNAALAAVNPTATQIVPIIQSIAQRYFNKIGSAKDKDKKLSKDEKQQTAAVVKDDKQLFERNKGLNQPKLSAPQFRGRGRGRGRR